MPTLTFESTSHTKWHADYTYRLSQCPKRGPGGTFSVQIANFNNKRRTGSPKCRKTIERMSEM
jgi:hypothetical protein